ncbi:MAG: 5-oxoproline transporter, DUF979 family subunit, partial [Sphingopyxis sp.]
MIGLGFIYMVAGLCFAGFAVLGARDAGHPKRWGNAAFWALMAVSMLAGDALGDMLNGVLVLALTALAATGRVGRGAPRPAAPAPVVPAHMAPATSPLATPAPAVPWVPANRLMVLALTIPAAALVGTIIFPAMPGVVEGKHATLVALVMGVLIAVALGLAWFRAPLAQPLHQGRRLADNVGWAVILPQMLASL